MRPPLPVLDRPLRLGVVGLGQIAELMVPPYLAHPQIDVVALCEKTKPVAIIVRYGKVDARIMDAAENLQVISKHGSGIDVIDQEAAAARGIAVRAAVGANAAAVAEHAWALILACAKSVPISAL